MGEILNTAGAIIPQVAILFILLCQVMRDYAAYIRYRTTREDFKTACIATLATVALLAWGGFFDRSANLILWLAK